MADYNRLGHYRHTVLDFQDPHTDGPRTQRGQAGRGCRAVASADAACPGLEAKFSTAAVGLVRAAPAGFALAENQRSLCHLDQRDHAAADAGLDGDSLLPAV